ncbi:MAG: formate--tetrahydrofolate ligase [Deltaproteobacteria bacterium]|nr:formate--tetrahydrofolate ligase [Deltaproteobacteria bacterium]
MKTDLEIAASARLRPITEVAGALDIPTGHLIPFGRHFAKIDAGYFKEVGQKPSGRLILVTAMSPTPEGEGKTTLTIGLAQALKLLNKRVSACIRQPSLGPFFGAKGGATGGGYSQVLPPEEISIHFTGDDHAVTAAHNLISSMMDNSIHYGNPLNINAQRILWPRITEVNDRALRTIKVNAGLTSERGDQFHISAASELMSVLCLSLDIKELRSRAGEIIVAFDAKGAPVKVADLKAHGSAAALLKNAINPNLVQSIEGVPVFVHGGPFGNISIGCNSLLSTAMALKSSDYVFTEAGFATELGAEKFFDIKCRAGGLNPSCVVIVATLRSLRFHGGSKDYKAGDARAALRGIDNLKKHIENITKFNLPSLVALNRYIDDDPHEMDEVMKALRSEGINAVTADVRELGGRGGLEAGEEIVRLCERENGLKYLYDNGSSIEEKVSTIAREMYGAEDAVFTEEAKDEAAELKRLGYGALPVCVAKTPKSLSDDPALIGRPKGFSITVRRVRPAAGAGFIIAECGNILLMPGLPKHPRAESIDIDDNGRIRGI